MLLFDELAAALQDLHLDKYSALTLALSRLGIQVLKQPVQSADDGNTQLCIQVDLSDSDEEGAVPRAAKFDSSTRRWKLSSRPRGRNPRTSSEQKIQREDASWTRYRSRSRAQTQYLSIDDVLHDVSPPPDMCLNWTDELSPTEHNAFLINTDWTSTELGPIEKWPAPLRLMIRKMLADPRPANLYWGKGRVAIYNEQFSIMAHNRHPAMMGAKAEVAMPLTWPFLQNMFNEIERSGVAFSLPEFEMIVEKVAGFTEEAWYDAMFSPISDDNGKFLGLYNSGYEITAPVMLKRRLNLLHKMASPPNLHETTVWKHIMGSVESFERDLPFFAIYSAAAGDTSQRLTCHLWLEGFAGIEAGHAALPESFDLYDSGEAFGPACRVAKATGKPVVLGTDDGGRIPDALNGDIEWQGHGQVATRVAIIPIFTTGRIAGFVVAALNPLRPYDEAHEQFVSDIGHVVTTLLSSAVSFEQARAREAQLMKELTERERFTRIMAEVATVGIFNLDLDGTITWANSRYYEITQLSTDSVKSSLWMDCVLKEDHLKVTQCLARCRRAHEPTTCDVRLKETWQPPNGAAEEPQWVLASLRPHMEDGVFQGVMGSLSDISHVKWSEQLQKSNADAAITAQVQLTSFMDLSSHELRNPLSAVIQCADDICFLIERARDSGSGDIKQTSDTLDGILENAQTILLCSAHSKRLVDDVLTFSKLDSSLLTLTAVLISPVEIGRKVLQMFKAEAAASKISLTFIKEKSFNDLGKDYFHGDPTRITQCLVNLLTNALKFTKTSAKERKVEIRIGSCPESPPKDIGQVEWYPSGTVRQRGIELDGLGTGQVVYLIFQVRDTGKGMNAKEMSKLFNRFSQANKLTHVEYGGSGLGLFLSRELTELHGGQIGTQSIPEEGTTMVFFIKTMRATPEEERTAALDASALSHRSSRSTLAAAPGLKPCSPTPSQSIRFEAPRPTVSASVVQKYHILLVEDNLINQQVLSKQLRRAGCAVEISNHGDEALNFIKTTRYWHENNGLGHEISFILMDWEMPIRDGISATKEIRSLEKDGLITKHLTIIATTANVRTEQVKVAMDAGMDDLLAKPFKVADVMKKIASLS